MSCEFCLGDDCDEIVSDYEEWQAPAHSDTRCKECRRTFPKGTSMMFCSFEFEGEEDGHATCLTCHEIRNAFSCDEEGAVAFGELWEQMNDYGFQYLTTASECFRVLKADTKEYLLSRWRDWKFSSIS